MSIIVWTRIPGTGWQNGFRMEIYFQVISGSAIENMYTTLTVFKDNV